jgi:hypothetical protein
MLELDPKYCDVIVKRYLENTGNSDGVFLLRDGVKMPWTEAVEQAS